MAIDFTKPSGDIDFSTGGQEINGAGRNIALQNKVVNKPEKGFSLLGGLTSVAKGIGTGLESFGEGVENVLGGAISAAPKVVSNVAGFGADVLGDVTQKVGNLFGANITDEQAKSLGNFLKKEGIETEAELQEFLGTDPDAFLTKTGAFGTEVASLFTPAGAAKIVPGIAKAKGLVGTLAKGAELGAKAEIIGEGEVTPEGLIVGAATEGLAKPIGLLGQKIAPKTREALVKKVHDQMEGLFKFSAKSGKSTKQIATERANIIQGAEELQRVNPFKIKNKDTALQETGEAISTAKEKLFNDMKGLRADATRPLVNTKTLESEFKKLIKSDRDLRTLIEKGGGNTEYNRILSTLKKNDKYYKEPMEDVYATIKMFNSKGGTIFSSTADNITARVNAAASKAYNNALDKSLGKLSGPYRDLNRQYSKIRNFEESIAAKYKNELSKSKQNVLGNLSEAYIDSGIIFNALNPKVAAPLLGTKLLKNYLSNLANPNTRITNVMNAIRQLEGIDVPLITEGVERTAKDILKTGTTVLAEKFIK